MSKTKPIWYTVSGDFRTIGAAHAEDTEALVPVVGNITFTPMLANGDVILAADFDERPTGLVPISVTGVIDLDGRVKLKPQGDGEDLVPVKLMGDSPLLQLKTELFYRVTFSQIRFGTSPGTPGQITGFVFQAPKVNGFDLNLITVMRAPGQLAVGVMQGPPGPPGASGASGAPGPAGGPPGATGEPGSQWLFGEGPPPDGLLGARPGDIYMDRLTSIIYKLGD